MDATDRLASDRRFLDMPIEQAMRTQRAIRRLRPDPVDDALVLHLLELATKAPNGGNRQNVEFLVLRDPEAKKGIARLNRAAWSLYGNVWRVFARGDEKTLRAMRAVDDAAEHYEEAPLIIVVCLRVTSYGPIVSGFRLPFPAFWEAIFYGTAFPAVQNLLLAARAAGLGAALNVMPLWSLPLARFVLGLPPWVTPVAVVPLGWPKGRYGPTARAPVETVVHWNYWGNQAYACPPQDRARGNGTAERQR
jgi:nitroreductase